ncbi:MAG: hypothetical protein AB4050_20220 [Synechococcus sp.]
MAPFSAAFVTNLNPILLWTSISFFSEICWIRLLASFVPVIIPEALKIASPNKHRNIIVLTWPQLLLYPQIYAVAATVFAPKA